MHSYQILQTAPAARVIRLEVDGGLRREDVWRQLHRRVEAFLRTQGVSAEVTVGLSEEPPAVNTRSGKLRHVLGLTSTRPR